MSDRLEVSAPAAEVPGRAARQANLVLLRRLREYGIVVSTAALFLTLSVSSSVFLTSTNLLNILDQMAPVGIITTCQTLVIIGGGLDLSVGATFAICGVIATELVGQFGSWGSIVVGALAGLVVGYANGLLVTVFRINAFILTLASSFVVYGLAQVITGGYLVTVSQANFAVLGNNGFLSIKYAIWLLLAVFLLATVLLRTTWLGRHIFAIGGNAEAARLSGVRVDWVRATTFGLCGLAAGVAGVLAASQISQGQADVGSDLTLTSIAAVVIGGTSILGGEGAIWRSILGVFLLSLIGNGFDLLNLNPIYQQIVEGAIIIVAVSVDSFARRSTR